MGSLDTGVWINGIAVEFAAPFELRLSRGAESWRAEIPVSDDRFDGVSNPITIKFRTPDDKGGAIEHEWKNWYITQKAVKDEGLYSLIVQDVRWAKSFNKLTRAYNIRWWGEEDKYQIDSLNNGTPWKAYDAVVDALQRFGFEVEDNTNLPAALKQVVLPDNLSIALGGGFQAASLQEVMPLLLEAIRCDMTITPAGKIMVIDRSSMAAGSDKLVNFKAIGGRAETRDNSWARPEKVVLLLPRRIEIGLRYDEAAIFGSTSAGELYEVPDLEVENVIPDVDFGASLAGGGGQLLANIEHAQWYDTVRRKIGFSRSRVLDVIMKPRIFPFDANSAGNPVTAEEYFKRQVMEGLMKETYRRRFRVRKVIVGNQDMTRALADIKMGRLDPNGTTKEEGNVFMDYVRINRFSRYNNNGPANGGSIFDATFSDNVPYNLFLPAPFEARWITADIDDLMFEVDGQRRRLLDVEYWPGQLKTPMRFGDISDIVDGKPLAAVESTLKLTTQFRLLVIAHGLLVAERAGVTRDYEHEIGDRQGLWAALPAGARKGPILYIRVDDMSANYKYTSFFPGQLINRSLIEKRAEEVAKEVNQTFMQSRLGVVTYDGVDSLEKGVLTSGDIYDTVVQVGYDAPHTITTTYMILPEIRSVRGNRDDYTSVSVTVIGG